MSPCGRCVLATAHVRTQHLWDVLPGHPEPLKPRSLWALGLARPCCHLSAHWRAWEGFYWKHISPPAHLQVPILPLYNTVTFKIKILTFIIKNYLVIDLDQLLKKKIRLRSIIRSRKILIGLAYFRFGVWKAMVGSKLTKIHMVNSMVVTATLYSTRIPEDRLSTHGKFPSGIKPQVSLG